MKSMLKCVVSPPALSPLIIAIALAMPATGHASDKASAQAPSAADALAQKFIDGPAHEEAERNRKSAQPTWDERLDALSAKLRQARKVHGGDHEPSWQANEQPSRQPSWPPGLTTPTGEHRFGKVTPQTETPGHPELAQPALPPSRQAAPPRMAQAAAAASRVTVLMVMRTRRPGFRGIDSSIDPVLCTRWHCYISRGAGDNAREIRRIAALGPINALGRRAGACRRTPHCIFRQVELAASSAEVQPVDLGWLRHDRREMVRITPDPSCEVTGGRLSCRAAVEGSNYRLWVVPEDVARHAGPAALQEALYAGLRTPRKQASAESGAVIR
jgi:hypothetical protein